MVHNKLTIEQLNKRLEDRGCTYRVVSEIKIGNKPYLNYHCTKCNQNFTRYRHWIIGKKHNCPVCTNHEVITGYNDVGTTNPEVIKYFVYKEEYENHVAKSEYKALVKCPKCGLERRMGIDRITNPQRGFICPCDDSYILYYEGVNELKVTNPEVFDMLLNKEDGIGVTRGSKKEVSFKCKICGNIFKRRISNACNIGINCPVCSDTISYPNKVARYFIKQTDAENVDFEYTKDWCNGKRYDVYFEYKGQKYFIEMDGQQHYRKDYYFHNQSYEEIHKNDLLKEKLAREHNIVLIRINCSISDIEYIKNNILNSKLNNLFDLNNIDWEKIEKDSRESNYLSSICKDYCEEKLFIKEIAEKYDTTCDAVERYVSNGKKLGLIPNDTDGNLRAVRIKAKRKKEIPNNE